MDKKRKAIELIYNKLNLDINNLDDDVKHDYLTINKGKDNNIYIWYYDGIHELAINIETLEILNNEGIEKVLE